MKRLFGLALVGLVALALTLPASSAADGVISGTWKLTYLAATGNAEITNWLFKLETEGGKTTAKLLGASSAATKAGAALVSFTLTGDHVRLVVDANGEKVFQGRVSKDGKKIVGVFTQQAMTAAYMAPTDMTKIETQDVTHKLGIDQLDKITQLTNGITQLAMKANKAEDADAKSKLQKEVAEANRELNVEVPKLLMDIIAKHPGTFAASRAALALVQRKAMAAKPAELKSWAELASGSAGEFGPIWSAEVNTDIATALLARKNQDLAVGFARSAKLALDDTCSLELQAKVLETLKLTLEQAGAPAAEQAPVALRLNTLTVALDKEYLSKAPAFKAAKFAGRKGQSDRVVLLELFTGAQCPPCVASDVAFDELEKNYSPQELVLLQYHLHIPGPDPMTNPDTEARAKFYAIGGTPTMFFNGSEKLVGGGPMAAAEKLYQRYLAVIDPLLETAADCKLSASAKRVGDKIQLQAHLSGVQKPGDKIKLHLVVAEDKVRFVGANKLRFHHQVVRAMPGGVAGVAVMNPTLSVEETVDLNKLREGFHGYLDDYAETKRPFPQPGRPMSMEQLRVIAFVQDDASHEILQAVQVPVGN